MTFLPPEVRCIGCGKVWKYQELMDVVYEEYPDERFTLWGKCGEFEIGIDVLMSLPLADRVGFLITRCPECQQGEEK